MLTVGARYDIDREITFEDVPITPLFKLSDINCVCHSMGPIIVRVGLLPCPIAISPALLPPPAIDR
jgi:hypothetical protein